MLDELVAVYGVVEFVATLKARNYRSLALLRRLEFGAESERGTLVAARESDEVVMFKRLGAVDVTANKGAV